MSGVGSDFPNIEQITPADGWYVQVEEPGEAIDEYPLAAWALVRDDGAATVTGLVAYGGSLVTVQRAFEGATITYALGSVSARVSRT